MVPHNFWCSEKLVTWETIVWNLADIRHPMVRTISINITANMNHRSTPIHIDRLLFFALSNKFLFHCDWEFSSSFTQMDSTVIENYLKLAHNWLLRIYRYTTICMYFWGASGTASTMIGRLCRPWYLPSLYCLDSSFILQCLSSLNLASLHRCSFLHCLHTIYTFGAMTSKACTQCAFVTCMPKERAHPYF